MRKLFFPIVCFCLLLWRASAHAGSDPLKVCAQELADGLSKQKNIRVAVLAIPYYNNRSVEAPYIVSELLTTYLAKDKTLMILERQQIAQALKEFHMAETGLFSPSSVKRLGLMLGADVIVTGTLIDIDNHKTELNVRGVSSSNGRIICASRAILDRTWATRPVLQW